MSQHKPFFEQLLKKHNMHLDKRHMHLLDDFLNDSLTVEAFNIIQNTQSNMLENWKEKTRIEDIKAKQIVLPNGTVGKSYEYILDLDKLGINDIGDYELEIDEKIGITFNKTESKILGTLKEPGEHILILNFKLKNSVAEKPFSQKEIKLIVNHNPKSLWKDLPSDNKDSYWKDDNAASHSNFGSKKLVIGSKRGRSHAHEGKFRDDDFGYAYDDTTGWGIISVADGAGSAKYSRRGSQLACKSVIDFFMSVDGNKFKEIDTATIEFLNEQSEDNQKKLSSHFIEQLGKAAFTAQGAIREEAATRNAEIKDYSTTLIFSLIKKYANCFVIVSFWVGDGGIGIYNDDKKEVHVLGIPDSGEFAGQTRFLTMSDIFTDGAYANRIRFKIIDDFTALILMTDGITDPKFQTDANLNRIEKWDELWKDLQGQNAEGCKVTFDQPLEYVESELMNWLDFWSAGNHDDRTLAILF